MYLPLILSWCSTFLSQQIVNYVHKFLVIISISKLIDVQSPNLKIIRQLFCYVAKRIAFRKDSQNVTSITSRYKISFEHFPEEL